MRSSIRGQTVIHQSIFSALFVTRGSADLIGAHVKHPMEHATERSEHASHQPQQPLLRSAGPRASSRSLQRLVGSPEPDRDAPLDRRLEGEVTGRSVTVAEEPMLWLDLRTDVLRQWAARPEAAATRRKDRTRQLTRHRGALSACQGRVGIATVSIRPRV